MRRATTLLAVGAALILAGATDAAAQTSGELLPFAAVYAGAQPQRRTITSTETFPLYDETATVTSSQRIRNGGLFKVAVGFPISGRFGVGGGVSYFGRPGTAIVAASLPSPIFTDTFTTVNLDADDLKHTELGINFNVLYQLPVSEKLSLTLSAGPSLIRVQQDIANVDVSAAGALSVTPDAQSGNAIGANGGVDVIYQLRPAFGLGIFVHYMGGKVDLPSAEGMSVGGAQAGVVVRFGL